MSSFFRRHPDPDDLDTDDENDAVDPELRLRTTRTAHSTIAESIRAEEKAERRKTMRKKRSFFRTRSTKSSDGKKRPSTAKSEMSASDAVEVASSPPVTGLRRNIYVNMRLPADEVAADGEPIVRYVRNKVRTTSEHSPFFILSFASSSCPTEYTILTFIPKNLYEQFRR